MLCDGDYCVGLQMKFGVNSSSRFSFIARTHNRLTDASVNVYPYLGYDALHAVDIVVGQQLR